MLVYLMALLIGLAGCSNASNTRQPALSWQEVNGRNNEAVYRVCVPTSWTRESLLIAEDTTKPIASFFIHEGNDKVILTIHNFPEQQESRIPPEAQVNRWKEQLKPENPHSFQVIPQAFAGFIGLRFEGSGLLNEKPMMILAWAMELAPEHFMRLTARLQNAQDSKTTDSILQHRASYTIKAVGPESLIGKHRQKIIAFARSFELIHELPELSQ